MIQTDTRSTSTIAKAEACQTPSLITPEQMIIDLGYQPHTRLDLDRDKAKSAILKLFAGNARDRLVLIEHPQKFGIDGAGVYYECKSDVTIGVFRRLQYGPIEFRVLSDTMSQSLLVYTNSAIDEIRQLNSPFDADDPNGIYFQYVSSGVSGRCTVGIFVSSATKFSVYEKGAQ